MNTIMAITPIFDRIQNIKRPKTVTEEEKLIEKKIED